MPGWPTGGDVDHNPLPAFPSQGGNGADRVGPAHRRTGNLRSTRETAGRRGGAFVLGLMDLARRGPLRLQEKGGTPRWQRITVRLATGLAEHAECRSAGLPTDVLLRYRGGGAVNRSGFLGGYATRGSARVHRPLQGRGDEGAGVWSPVGGGCGVRHRRVSRRWCVRRL
jgi:hypothetical protein